MIIYLFFNTFLIKTFLGYTLFFKQFLLLITTKEKTLIFYRGTSTIC